MRVIGKNLVQILLVGVLFFTATAQQNSENLSLTVTISKDSEFLKNLTAEDFEIFLNDKRGLVDLVKQEDEPVSVGFLVDISASMLGNRSRKSNKMALGVKGFSSFLANANRANDYFVMSFAKNINLVLDSTQDGEKVKKSLDELAAKELRESDTRLYEAMKTAYEKIQSAKNQKRVLLLISDGQDNSNTKLKITDIEKLIRQNDVLLYVVRVLPDEIFQDSPELALSLRKVPVFERDYKRLQFEIAPFPAVVPNIFLDSIKRLDDLSSASGGRVFYPLNQNEADRAFEILADELKSQYRMVVSPPSDLKKDRAMEVKIKTPKLKDTKKLSVRSRTEVYF